MTRPRAPPPAWWRILLNVLLPASALATPLLPADAQIPYLVGSLIANLAYFILESQLANERLARLEGAVDQLAQVELLDEDEFYARWQSVLRRAKSASIMYMAERAPNATKDKQKRAYYDSFPSFVRQRQMQVRRLDRASQQMWPWIEKIVTELRGFDKFSYAVVEGPDPGLSVQIVDSKHTFLVAIGRQDAYEGHRDAVVHSAPFAASWTHYYESSWKRARTLIKSGVVDEAAFKELKAKYGPRRPR